MKRFYVCLAAVLFTLAIALIGCSNAVNDEKPANEEKAEDAQSEAAPEDEELLIAPAEDPQIARDNEMTLEYLSMLGLDESSSFQLRETIPTGNGDIKSYLVNVENISEDDFEAIQQALESNGFIIVSDIMEDTERQFKSYQYSNENDLYIEIGYSYGAGYFDVHFVPIS
ncbi:MAG: hypothetical protein AB1Z23_11010 [Eubacteriales bacterium]